MAGSHVPVYLSLVFVLLVSGIVEAVVAETYRAAVVEFEADAGSAGLTPIQKLQNNVIRYQAILYEASEQNTDIIVFPEYGLTSLTIHGGYLDDLMQVIPDIGDLPCNEEAEIKSEVIFNISCTVKTTGIWTVINLGEKVTNEEGSTLARFNTAVVFDREGRINAKYRKENLFAEPIFTQPETSSPTSFPTDFGVTFGVIICFDLLFKTPATNLLASGVRHYVFPTAWIDELPFLTAIQAQSMWASSSNATLLAAGYHSPRTGNLGSGIFLPSGDPLTYVFEPTSGTRVLYADVPKNLKEAPSITEKTRETSADQWSAFYYRENLSNYTSMPLNPSETAAEVRDGSFCCRIQYRLSSERKSPNVGNSLDSADYFDAYPEAHYRLMAFNDTRNFQSPSVTKKMALQVCSVVRCLGTGIQSCAENGAGAVLQAFEELRLTAGPFQVNENTKPSYAALDIHFRLGNSTNLAIEQGEGYLSLSARGNFEEFDVQTVALFHRTFSSEA